MFGKKDTKDKDYEAFVIFDSKAGYYGMPIFVRTHHELLRDLTNMFRDPKEARNKLLLNSEDFSIFRIGYYNQSKGEFVPQNNEHIANIIDLRSMIMRENAQRDVSQPIDLGIVST